MNFREQLSEAYKAGFNQGLQELYAGVHEGAHEEDEGYHEGMKRGLMAGYHEAMKEMDHEEDEGYHEGAHEMDEKALAELGRMMIRAGMHEMDHEEDEGMHEGEHEESFHPGRRRFRNPYRVFNPNNPFGKKSGPDGRPIYTPQ